MFLSLKILLEHLYFLIIGHGTMEVPTKASQIGKWQEKSGPWETPCTIQVAITKELHRFHKPFFFVALVYICMITSHLS